MNQDLYFLILTALSIGFFHTLLGPDHYLPFIVMSKSNQWSVRKTVAVTVLCGIGHIGSSLVLGSLGIAIGISSSKLEIFESMRGNIAAWLLMIFGFIYLVWGIRYMVKNRPHTHFHYHGNETFHTHEHGHFDEHSHVHTGDKKKLTPWVLFIIFILGPCEPFIPILMYPAAKNSIPGLVIVTLTFGIATIATMLGIVLLSSLGFHFMPFKKMEKYSHAFAGLIIFMCGAAIQFLGL